MAMVPHIHWGTYAIYRNFILVWPVQTIDFTKANMPCVSRFYFPDSPQTAWFLTPEERVMAVKRIRSNQSGVENKHFKREQYVLPLFWIRSLTVLVSGCWRHSEIRRHGYFPYCELRPGRRIHQSLMTCLIDVAHPARLFGRVYNRLTANTELKFIIDVHSNIPNSVNC